MHSIWIPACQYTTPIAYLRNTIPIYPYKNTLIIVISSTITLKTGYTSFKQRKILKFSIFFANRMVFTRLTLKTFLSKVENLLFQVKSEYNICQPRVVVFIYYFILFIDTVDILAVTFWVFL